MKVKLGIITWCYLLLMLINHNKDSYYVSAKSLDTTQQNCNEHVGEFFKSFLNISIISSEKIGKTKTQLIFYYAPSSKISIKFFTCHQKQVIKAI